MRQVAMNLADKSVSKYGPVSANCSICQAANEKRAMTIFISRGLSAAAETERVLSPPIRVRAPGANDQIAAALLPSFLPPVNTACVTYIPMATRILMS